MRAFLAELFAPLHVDQRRDGIRIFGIGIIERGRPLRLDEHRPA
jgi:hypothetical protein